MLKEVNDLGLVNDLSDYKVSFNQFNKVLGFFIDDTIVGFLDYSVIYDRLEVNYIFVKEKYRRQNIAYRLLSYIINNYDQGINANPFVDSTGFSQGQKQRLAIARALYSNPDILILDEATSSLDLKTEAEICNTLKNLKGEKTIIAIAHRLSTIKFADRVVFMKNAEIMDIAAFDELLKRNEDFRELVKIASFK